MVNQLPKFFNKRQFSRLSSHLNSLEHTVNHMTMEYELYIFSKTNLTKLTKNYNNFCNSLIHSLYTCVNNITHILALWRPIKGKQVGRIDCTIRPWEEEGEEKKVELKHPTSPPPNVPKLIH